MGGMDTCSTSSSTVGSGASQSMPKSSGESYIDIRFKISLSHNTNAKILITYFKHPSSSKLLGYWNCGK